jgi:hypothetical protein
LLSSCTLFFVSFIQPLSRHSRLFHLPNQPYDIQGPGHCCRRQHVSSPRAINSFYCASIDTCSRYERAHITQWLLTSSKSPLTTLPLRHKRLRQNRTLRSAVDEYLAARSAGGAAPPAAATTVPSSPSSRSVCVLM